MIDYEKIISQWQKSVEKYCADRNIPNMELRNLRMDDLYDYALYVSYNRAKNAVDTYRKTPSSPLFANNMVKAIKKWYVAVTDSGIRKLAMEALPNGIFARFITRIK